MNPKAAASRPGRARTPQGNPAVAVREDFPDRRRADGAGQRRRGRRSRRTGGRPLGPRRRACRLPPGPVRQRGDRRGDGQRAAGAVRRAACPKAGSNHPQALDLLAAGDQRRRAAALRGRARRARASDAPTGRLEPASDPRVLGAGSHRVQMLATDTDGQSTLSLAARRCWSTASRRIVTITRVRGGHGVSVRVSDSYAGVDTHRRQGQLRRRPQRRAAELASATATPARASTGWSSTCATSSAQASVVSRWVSVR